MNIRIAGTAEPTVEDRGTAQAAVLGRDYPGSRFELLVESGARIRAGEPLLRDRRRPGIVITAPISGAVGAVERGARRALVSVQIAAGAALDEPVAVDVPDRLSRSAARDLLLKAGLWAAIRKRPFGLVPDPDAEPRAMLVTAIDTEPLSPDPLATIARHPQQFTSGLELMAAACGGPVYLCQAGGAVMPAQVPVGVETAEFDGPHPAGLPGTHIHALCPIGFGGGEVWHVGYQDVIAAGWVLNTGRPWFKRIIALAGPSVRRPRLLTVPLGADVRDLTAGEIEDGPVRIVSGSVLSGHIAAGAEAFVGRRHNQITVLPEAAERVQSPRAGPGGRPGPLIPTGDLDRVAPPGILPVPLLRALLVGDIDRARELGAFELVEEDMALLSYVCPSGNDYGGLLRAVLAQLSKEAA